MQTRPTPTGILVSVLFFAVCGLLELGLGVLEAPRPLQFWPVWEALGRAILYWLLAAGLWHRFALCRHVAIVYCLATLVTYAVVETDSTGCTRLTETCTGCTCSTTRRRSLTRWPRVVASSGGACRSR